MADDAGALLVRAGLISSHHLAAARALQAADGGTVGEHLVAISAVADEALTEFYRSRLMVPQVNPNTLARLANAVVAVLPGDMAVEFRAVPVSLDKDGNLTVAMSDPSDRHAVDEIAFFTGKYVVRAVATQMQIAWCLAQYYGHVTELGERLLQPVAHEGGPPPAVAKPAEDAAPSSGAPAALPRARGDTARVQASRHRVLAPVTTPPPVGPRPGPEALLRTPSTGSALPQPGTAASGTNGATTAPSPATSSAPPPATSSAPPAPTASTPPAATTPAELAAAEAPVEIEMAVDDPSGPVRLPSEMPPGVLTPPAAATAAAATAAPAPQPPGVEGGSPTVIISHEATTPRRRRPALPDPPELAARSGEMEIQRHDARFDEPAETVQVHLEDDEPALVVAPPPVVIDEGSGGAAARPISEDDVRPDTEPELEDDDLEPDDDDDDDDDDDADDDADGADDDDDSDDDDDEPALIHDEPDEAGYVDGSESQPILLDKPRRAESNPALVLDSPPVADAPDQAAPAPPVRDEPSGPILLLDRKKLGERRRDKRTQIGIGTFGALGPIPTSVEREAAAAPTRPVAGEAIPAPVNEDDEAKTRRVDTRPPTSSIDDDWGPPGTTIPPPFLGAVVPADDPTSGHIPVHDDGLDSAPLLINPPRVEQPRARAPSSAMAGDVTEQARALEAAAIKLVEALRRFDQATTRDHVIAMLVDFVGESHHRVAFLAAKPGELTAFMQNPPPGGPQAQLPLSAPSLFQDVVGTRLPYRGPISDPVSREFVRALFGSTTDEMLAVPVAVRERVVGVIYADGRQRRAFDEHVTVASRAAGMALERLLKAKKG